jgi:hypothetical protein
MCKGNAFQPTSSMAQKKIEYAQGLFSWMNLKNTSSKKSYRTFFPEVKYKTKFTVPHCTSVIQFSFFFFMDKVYTATVNIFKNIFDDDG